MEENSPSVDQYPSV